MYTGGTRPSPHHQNGTIAHAPLTATPSQRRQRRERPKSSGSALLTDAENEQLFGVLGPDRISLAAGVTQLLAATPDTPNQWRKLNVGVASLVKDYGMKTYAISLFDVFSGEGLWTQIL